MSNVALTGTAAPEDSATGVMIEQGVQQIALNNGYKASILANQQVIISKSGVAFVGPVKQSEIQQFWQDLAELGTIFDTHTGASTATGTVTLNNTYSVVTGTDYRITMKKGVTSLRSNATQSEVQQLWQDLALVGFAH